MSPRSDLSTPPRRLALFVALVATAVVLRLPLLVPSVIDWDESLYLLITRAWSAGGLPYETIWDHKPIGTYVLFRAIGALFGDGLAPIRLFGSVLVGTSAYLITQLLPVVAGRDDGETRRLGGLVGLAYILYCFLHGGLSTNTELMFTPLVALAALLTLRGGAPSLSRVAAIGLLMGAAFQIKYVVAAECALFAQILLWRMPRARRLAAAGVLVAAAAAPTVAAWAYFFAHGRAPLWFDSTVLANLRHTGMIAPTSVALKLLVWSLLHLPLLLALLWLVARREARVVVWWTVAAGIGVAGTGRFYDHYFLELLPPLCLALALAVRGVAGARAVKTLAVALAVAAPPMLLPLVRPIRELTAHGLAAAIPGTDLVARIAGRIRVLAAAGPPPSLYVFDHEPALYLLLDIRPPGRYIFPPILTRAHFSGVAGIDPVAELDANMSGRPEFVVKRADHDEPLESDSYNESVYHRMDALLSTDYVRVDTLEDVEIWRLREPLREPPRGAPP